MAFNKFESSPTFIGFIFIGLFFLSLVLGERFFTGRGFQFAFKKPAESVAKLPVDVALINTSPPWLKGKASRQLSIESWLKQYFPKKDFVLVNFWATWCAPCLEEIPSLDYLSRQLAGQEDNPKLPALLTISVDESEGDIFKLYSTLPTRPGFAVLLDRNGIVARSVNSVRFPETLLIHRDGRILYRWIGPQNWLSDGTLSHLASLASAK